MAAAVRLEIDAVRVLVGEANVTLSDDHHLRASTDADTTLCGAVPHDSRQSGVPLERLLSSFRDCSEDAYEDPEDVSRDVWVARWATETPGLCDDCVHVLRMALDHHCPDHADAGGSPHWMGDTCYDPEFCGLCGHGIERVLTFSHRIDSMSGYSLDELPDPDADVPTAGNE